MIKNRYVLALSIVGAFAFSLIISPAQANEPKLSTLNCGIYDSVSNVFLFAYCDTVKKIDIENKKDFATYFEKAKKAPC